VVDPFDNSPSLLEGEEEIDHFRPNVVEVLEPSKGKDSNLRELEKSTHSGRSIKALPRNNFRKS
jgi:hypothetical protein